MRLPMRSPPVNAQAETAGAPTGMRSPLNAARLLTMAVHIRTAGGAIEHGFAAMLPIFDRAVGVARSRARGHAGKGVGAPAGEHFGGAGIVQMHAESRAIVAAPLDLP